MTTRYVLQRMMQSGAFAVTSEMVMFQLCGHSKVRLASLKCPFLVHVAFNDANAWVFLESPFFPSMVHTMLQTLACFASQLGHASGWQRAGKVPR